MAFAAAPLLAPRNTQSSNVQALVEWKDEVYFGAVDGGATFSLYKTDGSAEGTQPFLALPGAKSIEAFEAADDFLYFVAAYNFPVVKLWVTDGTVAGTRQLPVESMAVKGEEAFSIGNTLYMEADVHDAMGWNVKALLETGELPGTSRFITYQGERLLRVNVLGQIGSKLFFSGQAASVGQELFSISPGENVQLVRDLVPGAIGGAPVQWAASGNAAYFIAGEVGSQRIWSTDGTESGTLPVAALDTLDERLVELKLAANGRLFYSRRADHSEGVGRLWVTDGTPGGESKLFNAPLVGFYRVGGDAYALNGIGGSDAGLWRIDLATLSITRITSSPIVQFTDTFQVGALVYGAGVTSTTSTLYRFDLTTGTLTVLKEFARLWVGVDFRFNAALGDRILFVARDALYNREVWVADGALVSLLKDINDFPPPATVIAGGADQGGYYVYLHEPNGKCHFRRVIEASPYFATTVFEPYECGSEFAIRNVLHYQIQRRQNGDFRQTLIFSGSMQIGLALGKFLEVSEIMDDDRFGILRISAEADQVGHELFVVPPSTPQIAQVVDIVPGPGSSYPAYLTKMSFGLTTFFATDATGLRSLWASDGTESGTRSIANLAITDRSRIVDFGSRALVTNVNQGEVWITDGTAAGTRPYGNHRFSDILPDVLEIGNDYFFIGRDSESRNGIWRAKATEKQPSLWLQLPTDILSVDEWAVSGDRFFLVANTPAGKQLWTARNQAALPLTDAARDGEPRSLTSGANGSVYFTADNSATGREVWFSDGTASGTGLAFDIQSGPASANPQQLQYDPVAKRLLVIGTSESLGDQVWAIQGTNVATRAVEVAAQSSRVSYAGMPDGLFRMQITYSRPMSITAEPSVTFTSAVANDSLPFDHGRWLDNQTYEAVFRLQGSGRADNVSVEVQGGIDNSGQPVVPMTFSNVFRLDLRDLPAGWHNAQMPMDVDRDGHVVPLDVVWLINDLNARGPRQLAADRPATDDALYMDVNNDGYVSPLDALLIINWMNAQGAGESQERPIAAADPSSTFEWLAWQQLALDEDEENPSASPAL